jgi:DNA-binding CsgD family transcriptional regulator/type II secretory pathway predicted ATPase ExeA
MARCSRGDRDLMSPRDTPYGRDLQLAEVVDGYAGGAVGVLVTGACGTGKSYLAAAAARQLSASGVRTASVRATRALGEIGFAAIADLIPAKVDGRHPLTVLRETARELAPNGNARAVLVVDDAQFLDPGSIAVLQHLARVEAAFLILTASSEPGIGERTCSVWHELGAARVQLEPLTTEEVRWVVEQRLGGRVRDRAARVLHRQSGGNPLYLHELISEAQDQDRLVERRGAWTLSGLPQPSARLAAMMARSLAGLSADERRALELLCLAERLPVGVLGALAGPEPTADLERRTLVALCEDEAVPGGYELELAYPLLGPIVREGLPAARAMALRRQLITALRREDPGPDRQYRIALLADDAAELGAEELCAAAEHALRSGDTGRAARFATLGAAHGEHAVCATLTLARALVAAGDHAAAEGLLAAHEDEALGAGDAAVYVDTRLAALLAGGAPLDDARRELRRLRKAASTRPATRALEDRLALLADLSGAGDRWSFAARLPADSALRAPAALAGLEHHLALGRVEDARRAGTDALEGVETLPGPHGQPELALVVAWVHLHVFSGSEWDACDRRLAELLAVAGHDDPLAAAAALGRGQLALARGMADTACRWLYDAIEGLEEHSPPLRLIALAELARAHALAGRRDDCSAALADVGPGIPLRLRFVWAPTLTLARAWAHAAEGELSSARAVLHAELEACPAEGLSRLVLLHDLLRLGEDARPLVAPLTALAETTGLEYARASATHAVGLAEQDAPALAEAAARFADLGTHLVAAEAELQASACYRSGGYVARSREYLTRSRYSLGRCETVLTPALIAADTEDTELTAREREIALIAARGLTNVEIAARLAISVRTVESHLYRAMTKMGAGRRAQLGELLGIAA